MDLKLKIDNDLDIVNGDLVLVDVSRYAIIQELNIRLGFYLDEWFLDTTAGIPYLQYIFQKGASLQTINGLFQKEILATAGVNNIIDFNIIFDNDNRIFTLDFKVDTIYGVITNIQEINI
jgi:hypothetical protein